MASHACGPGLVLVPTPQKLSHPEPSSQSCIPSGKQAAQSRKTSPFLSPTPAAAHTHHQRLLASVPCPRAPHQASGNWATDPVGRAAAEAACPHASDTHMLPRCHQPHQEHWAGWPGTGVYRVAWAGRCCRGEVARAAAPVPKDRCHITVGFHVLL